MPELTREANKELNDAMGMLRITSQKDKAAIVAARAICLEIAALREDINSELGNVVIAINDLHAALPG